MRYTSRHGMGALLALSAVSVACDMWDRPAPRRSYVPRTDPTNERKDMAAAEAKRQRKADKRLACRS